MRALRRCRTIAGLVGWSRLGESRDRGFHGWSETCSARSWCSLASRCLSRRDTIATPHGARPSLARSSDPAAGRSVGDSEAGPVRATDGTPGDPGSSRWRTDPRRPPPRRRDTGRTRRWAGPRPGARTPASFPSGQGRTRTGNLSGCPVFGRQDRSGCGSESPKLVRSRSSRPCATPRCPRARRACTHREKLSSFSTASILTNSAPWSRIGSCSSPRPVDSSLDAPVGEASSFDTSM